MPHYKDQNNSLHWLDDEAAEHLLPAGCVRITDEEADTIRQSFVTTVTSCTPWQLRKVLNQVGLRAEVESAVAASGDLALKDGWEYATEFRSDDAFVLSMGQSLGLTSQQVDELFVLAAAL